MCSFNCPIPVRLAKYFAKRKSQVLGKMGMYSRVPNHYQYGGTASTTMQNEQHVTRSMLHHNQQELSRLPFISPRQCLPHPDSPCLSTSLAITRDASLPSDYRRRGVRTEHVHEKKKKKSKHGQRESTRPKSATIEREEGFSPKGGRTRESMVEYTSRHCLLPTVY